MTNKLLLVLLICIGAAICGCAENPEGSTQDTPDAPIAQSPTARQSTPVEPAAPLTTGDQSEIPAFEFTTSPDGNSTSLMETTDRITIYLQNNLPKPYDMMVSLQKPKCGGDGTLTEIWSGVIEPNSIVSIGLSKELIVKNLVSNGYSIPLLALATAYPLNDTNYQHRIDVGAFPFYYIESANGQEILSQTQLDQKYPYGAIDEKVDPITRANHGQIGYGCAETSNGQDDHDFEGTGEAN